MNLKLTNILKERKNMSIENKIVNDIINHIGYDNKSGWYVGIATDIRQRLFFGHNVAEHGGGRWIYCKAANEQNARDTEKYLLDNYSFKGDTGGGNNPKYVYAYQITNYTKE